MRCKVLTCVALLTLIKHGEYRVWPQTGSEISSPDSLGGWNFSLDSAFPGQAETRMFLVANELCAILCVYVGSLSASLKCFGFCQYVGVMGVCANTNMPTVGCLA